MLATSTVAGCILRTVGPLIAIYTPLRHLWLTFYELVGVLNLV